MTSVLLAGLGAVGARAARQLVDTPGIDRVLLAGRGRDRRRATAVAAAMAGRAEVCDWRPGDEPPDGVRVVACALPGGVDAVAAAPVVGAGVDLVSCADDRGGIAALTALGPRARRSGSRIVAGAGLAPGLADVLARHAGSTLDAVTTVRVARTGHAGSASRDALRRALRERPREWRAGAWNDDPRRGGHELVWFPDPVGSKECQLVDVGVDLLVDGFPGLERASVRFESPPPERRHLIPGGGPGDDGWAAARVEVSGRRGVGWETLVYGVVERTAVAAGTVLAVTAAHLAGALAVGDAPAPGATGLAPAVDPVAFLAELGTRGVRAAAFEGAPV